MYKIPLVKPEFNVQQLTKDLVKINQSGILTQGPYLAAFENKLKKYLRVKYAFAVSSCTTALHLALTALEIKSGDEVLVSDFTFPASGNVVVQVGAKPIFLDIDLETFNAASENIEKLVTKKTKAMIVVHAFGLPAKMAEILKIARKHHLTVIEDAACALGSIHQKKFCGGWGDIGCFSFHPRKNITTGEGGAIVTNNPRLAQKIEILRHHGGVKKNHYWQFVECGFNYRLSEIAAALGLEQMEKLKMINQKRQALAKIYLNKLKEIPGIRLPTEPKDGIFNFQSLVILLPPNINRQKLIDFLGRQGIETVLGTYALHCQPAFRRFGYRPGDRPNSYFAYKHSLTLPLYSQMTESEIEYVVKKLKDFLTNPKS